VPTELEPGHRSGRLHQRTQPALHRAVADAELASDRRVGEADMEQCHELPVDRVERRARGGRPAAAPRHLRARAATELPAPVTEDVGSQERAAADRLRLEAEEEVVTLAGHFRTLMVPLSKGCLRRTTDRC
jgi:hypothetical protein